MNDVAFAPAYAEPAGSPIRELFPYLSRPGLVSFAGGYPSPALLDAEGLAQASARVFAGDPAGVVQYGATEGRPGLRAALADMSAGRGVRCEAADVLVTAGSQQAFDLLVRVFVAPGDTVLIETPAYPAAIQSLRLAGAHLTPLPVDMDGLQTDALETLLRAMPAGRRPKLLYTVPTFSNPSGSLLSQPRRERLVQLALEFGFLIVEDDPYGELNFSGAPVATIFAAGQRLAGARNPVLYLSSLSKTVAPSLRVGWMVAPADVLRRCAIAKQTMDLCTSPITQAIALAYLEAQRYESAVRRACDEYQRRMHAMVSALSQALGARIEAPPPGGGMFVWARFDHRVDPQTLFNAAVELGVLFVPGAAFQPQAQDPHTMRLSYAAPSLEAIATGVARLVRAFDIASHGCT
ncbi:DNA-binding transcriptional MocR family regulator [Pseudacidovorax sp. 1753]|uniref:aminotransferase-like domain-containing protein n=1 Tax=Pseudacidovorax sp. 1753 TaxID=3156419 RepID=UPI00339AD967